MTFRDWTDPRDSRQWPVTDRLSHLRVMRPFPRTLLVVFVHISWIVAACDKPPGEVAPTPSALTRDSASITVVENDQPTWDQPWRIEETPTVTIGDVPGRPVYELFRVSKQTNFATVAAFVVHSETKEGTNYVTRSTPHAHVRFDAVQTQIPYLKQLHRNLSDQPRDDVPLESASHRAEPTRLRRNGGSLPRSAPAAHWRPRHRGVSRRLRSAEGDDQRGEGAGGTRVTMRRPFAPPWRDTNRPR